jgi:protein TonB
VIGGVIAVGGITTGLVMRGHRTARPPVAVSTPAPTPAPAPVAPFPLELQVEPQGKGQINVRWNPQSTLIAQAREGRLVITENNQKPRTIPLGVDQLKFGHLTYQPQTERVEIRLEAVDPSGSVAEESVLSVGSAPASAAAQAAALATTAPAASTNTTPSATPQTTPAQPAPTPSRPAARAFTPPSVNRTPEQTTIVEAPPVLSDNGPSPTPFVAVQVPRPGAPPPTPAAPAANPAGRSIQVESSLQAAKLTKKVTPAYPALAKAARVQGTIHFQATIGKDGSVTNLQAVSGPPLLRQAATDAVKQWTYRPTLLNGQAVEVVTSIDVVFTLSQ